MIQKNSTIKKFTLITIIMMVFLMQSLISALCLFKFNKNVFAEVINNEISIANSNFTSYSGETPAEPSSFSAVGDKKSTVSGVIKTDTTSFQDKYENDYKLTFNPSHPSVSEDVNVLMINNQNINSSYGYKSSSFTLAKNGYYVVSAYVYTQYTVNDSNEENRIASTASLYLSNTRLDNLNESKIENVSTRGAWQEFRFYVKTASSDESVNLILFNGTQNSNKSAGAVFFDNLSAKTISETNFYELTKNVTDKQKTISLTDKNVTVENNILNGDFENNLQDFTKLASSTGSASSNNVAKVVGIGNNFDDEDSLITTNPTSANRLNNNYALLINNSSAGYVGFESNNIKIEQHKFYKLSLDVLTSNFTNNGAHIKLTQENPFNDEMYTPASSSFTSVNTSGKTNALTNNWISYSFYIKGNVFKNSFAKLTLTLGEENNLVNGYVFFDNINLYEITSADYDNNSSSDNCKAVDFSNFSSQPTINNAYFNEVVINSTEDTYPYVAKNITVTNNNKNNINGIINVHTNNFNAQNYPFTNPVSIYTSSSDVSYNNVFVLGNKEFGYQTAKTNSFTLNANSYYKVSLYVNTQNLINNNVNVKLITSSEVLGQVSNISTNSSWKEVSFVVKTYEDEKSCNLTFSLGSENLTDKGYVFFDNATITTLDEEKFNEFATNNLSYKTDLSKLDLNIKSENETNNYYKALNFTGTNNSVTGNSEAGILDISNPNTPDVGYVTSPNVLTIHNITDGYYTMKSNNYTLKSGNYYKITASVKTLYLYQEEVNKQYDNENNVIDFGAKIELTGINEGFKAIKTGNDYETYTFFINATSDTTINFNLSLGDEKALTRGYAFFDNLSIEKIDERTFTETKNNLTDEEDKILVIGTTETTEEEEPETTAPATNFDWLILPTLIISIALLIAMVGTLIRKLNIKLPVKTKVSDYDRAKTLVKDQAKRDLIKQREERLNALREQLLQLEKEIEYTKKEYRSTKVVKEKLQAKTFEIEKKIKQDYSDVNSKYAINEAKRLRAQAKSEIKQERKEKYLAKRNELIAKYMEIEKEIEMILEEERLLVEEYRAYRRQLKLEKKEAKLKKKNK